VFGKATPKKGKCLKISPVHPTKVDTEELPKQRPSLDVKESSNQININIDKSLTNCYKNSEENNLKSGYNNSISENNNKNLGQAQKTRLSGYEKRFVKMPLLPNEKRPIIPKWQTLKKSQPIREGQNTAIVTGIVRGLEIMLLISELKEVTLFVNPAFFKIRHIVRIIRNGAQFYQL